MTTIVDGPLIGDDEFGRRELELRRERVYGKLLTRASKTKMDKRGWFCLAEIADALAKGPEKLKPPDPTTRQNVVELLRAAVLRGDFAERLAFLHTSPHAELRFRPSWAENISQWNAWNTFSPVKLNRWNPPKPFPVTIWMRRADCVAWFKKCGLSWPPEDWKPERLTAKKGKAGRRAGYYWSEGLMFLEQELNKRGDPLDPANAAPGWQSQRDVEKLVQAHIEKYEKQKPSLSQVRHYVSPFMEEWRKKNRVAGN